MSMITLTLKKLRLSLTFGFFFVLALTTLRDNRLGTLSLIFCFAHELGHLSAMRLFGIKLYSLSFYGAGIKITSSAMDDIAKSAQALVYLAGPLTNLFLAVLFCGDLRAVNITLAIFNLLPIGYFDGGKLASLLLPDRAVILRTLSLLSCLTIFALTAYAVYKTSVTFNPSAIITFIFIAVSCILDG